MKMHYWTQRALTEQTPPRYERQLYCAYTCHWRHSKGCFVFGDCNVQDSANPFFPSTLRHPDCISMHGYFMKETLLEALRKTWRDLSAGVRIMGIDWSKEATRSRDGKDL